MTASSGTAFLTARTARSTSVSSLSACVPSSSFNFGSSLGNNATAGTPSLWIARHSFTRSAMFSRNWPGIDLISSGRGLPSTTKSGAMKSAGRSTVSSTNARSAGVRRRRRGRWVMSNLKFSAMVKTPRLKHARSPAATRFWRHRLPKPGHFLR
jgi:hypothetical protein